MFQAREEERVYESIKLVDGQTKYNKSSGCRLKPDYNTEERMTRDHRMKSMIYVCACQLNNLMVDCVFSDDQRKNYCQSITDNRIVGPVLNQLHQQQSFMAAVVHGI